MRVKDLIAELQLYDPELEISLYACGNGSQEIREIMFNLDEKNGAYITIEGDEYDGMDRIRSVL